MTQECMRHPSMKYGVYNMSILEFISDFIITFISSSGRLLLCIIIIMKTYSLYTSDKFTFDVFLLIIIYSSFKSTTHRLWKMGLH